MIPFHQELADFGVQLVEPALPLGGGSLGLAREHADRAFDSLPLPGTDQRLMYPVLSHQLGDRRLTADHLQRHLRLELGAVAFPFPATQPVLLVHGPSVAHCPDFGDDLCPARLRKPGK